MQKIAPDISVIMPVYNVEKYVGEAIESVLKQTFANFELIIVNDGSTDNTADVARSYTDDRIIFLDNKDNKKKPTRLNDGISIAKGKYIAIMDGDDKSTPDRLQKQYDYMESHPEILACGCQIQRFDGRNEKVSWPTISENIYLGLLFGCCFNFPLIRKSEYDKHSLSFDPVFLAEDYLMWIKLANIGEIVALPEVLYLYRTHNNQMSSTNLHNINMHVRLEKNLHINNLNKKLNSKTIEFEFWLDRPLKYEELQERSIFISNLIEKNGEEKLFTPTIFNQFLGKIWYRQFFLIKRINIKTFRFFISQKEMRKYAGLGMKNYIFFMSQMIKKTN
jgi:glycosyltransferase involved in cell wall biosynthesis